MTMRFKHGFLMTILFAASSPLRAQTIDALLGSVSSTTVQRIEASSARFLGLPYLTGGPLGEGPSGVYDQDPLYRFDGFDCTTFVETVMALSLAKDSAEFGKLMDLIRYDGGVVTYQTRNHFTDADWVPNNVRAGYIRDITAAVAGKEGAQTASAVIDKAACYRKMGLSTLSVPGASKKELAALLAKLNAEGQDIPAQTVDLPYVALDSIFLAGGKVNSDLLDRIPSGAIGNVVRPNWDLTSSIGTHMNVSHQFLVIRKGGRLLVRHATSAGEKKVVEAELVDYLRPYLTSPTIKGVNFNELLSR